jgi:hypothetical protein
MAVMMPLLCRGVIHPAIGAGKKFDRPDAVSHGAIMRRIERVFQPKRLLPSTTCYPDRGILGLSGSTFLTSKDSGSSGEVPRLLKGEALSVARIERSEIREWSHRAAQPVPDFAELNPG